MKQSTHSSTNNTQKYTNFARYNSRLAALFDNAMKDFDPEKQEEAYIKLANALATDESSLSGYKNRIDFANGITLVNPGQKTGDRMVDKMYVKAREEYIKNKLTEAGMEITPSNMDIYNSKHLPEINQYLDQRINLTENLQDNVNTIRDYARFAILVPSFRDAKPVLEALVNKFHGKIEMHDDPTYCAYHVYGNVTDLEPRDKDRQMLKTLNRLLSPEERRAEELIKAESKIQPDENVEIKPQDIYNVKFETQVMTYDGMLCKTYMDIMDYHPLRNDTPTPEEVARHEAYRKKHRPGFEKICQEIYRAGEFEASKADTSALRSCNVGYVMDMMVAGAKPNKKLRFFKLPDMKHREIHQYEGFGEVLACAGYAQDSLCYDLINMLGDIDLQSNKNVTPIIPTPEPAI